MWRGCPSCQVSPLTVPSDGIGALRGWRGKSWGGLGSLHRHASSVRFGMVSIRVYMPKGHEDKRDMESDLLDQNRAARRALGTEHDIHALSEKRRTQWYMRYTTTTACSGHVFPRPPVRWWGTKGKKGHAPTMFAIGHLESLRLSIRGIGLTCSRKLCAEPSSRHLDAQHRRSRAEALSASVPGLGSDGTIRRTTAESLQLTRRGQGTRNRLLCPAMQHAISCLPEEAGPHTALSVQRD